MIAFCCRAVSSQKDSCDTCYALPVQCIPYVSLSHRQIRSIVTSVAMAMKERGMNVVGKHLYYIYIDVPSSTAQTLFCLFIMIDS